MPGHRFARNPPLTPHGAKERESRSRSVPYGGERKNVQKEPTDFGNGSGKASPTIPPQHERTPRPANSLNVPPSPVWHFEQTSPRIDCRESPLGLASGFPGAQRADQFVFGLSPKWSHQRRVNPLQLVRLAVSLSGLLAVLPSDGGIEQRRPHMPGARLPATCWSVICSPQRCFPVRKIRNRRQSLA